MPLDMAMTPLDVEPDIQELFTAWAVGKVNFLAYRQSYFDILTSNILRQ